MNLKEYENEVNGILRNKLQVMRGNCLQCTNPKQCECRNKIVVNDIWLWLENITAIRRDDTDKTKGSYEHTD